MKIFTLLTAVTLLAGATASHGEVYAVPVNIKGIVVSDNTAIGKPKKAPVATADFLTFTNAATGLVLVYDTEIRRMSLHAVDSNTNSVALLADTSTIAILETDGSFSVSLTFGDCFFNTSNLLISNLTLGATVNSGALNLTGKIVPASGPVQKISAKVIGILNDSLCFTGDPDRTFKGVISSAGTVFDGSALGF